MRRPKAGLFGMPPPLTLDLSRFGGVETLPDPSNIEPPWLSVARNVTLDTGTLAVRPGLTEVLSKAQGGTFPFLGAGVLRVVADSDPLVVPEEVEYRRFVFVTQDINAGTGQPEVRVLAYDPDNPTDPTVITPLNDDHSVALVGAGRPTYFAQINNILYGVNGRDGLFYFDQALGDNQIVVASGLDGLPAPSVIGSFGGLRPDAGWTWHTSDAAKITVTDSPLNDPLHPLQFGVDQSGGFSLNVTSTGAGAWVYHAYAAALDLTTEAFTSDNLLLAQIIDHVTGETTAVKLGGPVSTPQAPIEMILGITVGGDNTTDPSNAAFAPTGQNSIKWQLSANTIYQWFFQRMPLSLDALLNASPAVKQRDILSKVNYIAFRVLTLPATLAPGFTLLLSDPCAPGVMPPGPVYYKMRAYNSSINLSGPLSEPSPFAFYDYPQTLAYLGALPNANELRRVKIVVDFSKLTDKVDTVFVYRTAPDPANTDPDLMPYRLVRTVHRSDLTLDADGNAFTYTFYDNVPLGTLLTADLPASLDIPVGDGLDAPWFIQAKDNRLIYARSQREPAGVWASDIGAPASVNPFEFESVAEPGKGGFARAGKDDGDEVMGLGRRSNEILIFKRRSVFAWTFLAEGTANETWKIERITTPGTVSTRSICEIPGGVVWMSDDGLYYLPSDSDVALPFPASIAVQRTIDAIPPAYKGTVACAYWPLRGWLLVAVPEPGKAVPTTLLVCDLRRRAPGHPIGVWFGEWKSAAVPSGETLSPGILFSEHEDLYVCRGDVGALDRFLLPSDPSPYLDYGTPIDFTVQTGWMEPLSGRKLRLLRRQLQFVFDGDDLGGQTATLAAILTLETRPNGDTQTYLYNRSQAAGSGPVGLVTTGDRGDDLCHPSLVGQQLRVTILGSAASPVAVRLLSLRLSYIELGLWKG